MRAKHLIPVKRNFKLSLQKPPFNNLQEYTGAIARLQQNQALIEQAINALNANLEQVLIFAASAARDAAASSTSQDPEAAITVDLFTALSNWTQMPAEL